MPKIVAAIRLSMEEGVSPHSPDQEEVVFSQGKSSGGRSCPTARGDLCPQPLAHRHCRGYPSWNGSAVSGGHCENCEGELPTCHSICGEIATGGISTLGTGRRSMFTHRIISLSAWRLSTPFIHHCRRLTSQLALDRDFPLSLSHLVQFFPLSPHLDIKMGIGWLRYLCSFFLGVQPVLQKGLSTVRR